MQDTTKFFEMALDHALSLMLARAKTAPKAKGVDALSYLIIEKEEVEALSQEIERLGIEKDVPFFIRDSKNILNAERVFIIGAKDEIRSIPQCGFCGYENCGHKLKNDGRCVYPLIDLGIAMGSALTMAQLSGIDTRMMYTVGKAALSLGLLEDCDVAIGIPMSITEKNVFFDRFTT